MSATVTSITKCDTEGFTDISYRDKITYLHSCGVACDEERPKDDREYTWDGNYKDYPW